MATEEPSLNSAHQHVANAEDSLARGLLIPAAEEHQKAADIFHACVTQTNDENTRRTLKMLYREHRKAAKELQARIVKLREENKDPTLPQLSAAPRASTAAAPAPPSHVPRPTSSPPPYVPGNRMMESSATVDESFMVLGGQRSDPGDAFNQFWKIMEGMLENLSQPVAFATAPLGSADVTSQRNGLSRNGSGSTDIDAQDNPLNHDIDPNGSQTTDGDILNDIEDFTDGDDLSGSFYMVPSRSEASAAVLKKENASLKAELASVQKRLAATERVMQFRKEQDQQLRDSIFLARREAQKAMGASFVVQRPGQVPVDINALNLNAPPVPPPVTSNGGRHREMQYLRRIKELEEELRVSHSENDKQKLMITRFRDRWDKLKETAKRKKDAKASAAAATVAIQERIVEEPEAEQELDEQAPS